jgi:FKBP-type peptidyl-prolyl cis-trans isomerase 2
LIGDVWVCRGETVIVTTMKGTITGKVRSITQNYIVLDITESISIITLDKIVWVKKK